MADVTFQEAGRRYRRLAAPAFIAYGVICIAGALLYKSLDHPPAWVGGMVAIASAAPLIGLLWLMGRLLRETDEYTRQRQFEAMLTGGGLTLSIAAIWGFLELYKIIPQSDGFPAMLMIWPLFYVLYGGAWGLQQRKRGEAMSDPTCMWKDTP